MGRLFWRNDGSAQSHRLYAERGNRASSFAISISLQRPFRHHGIGVYGRAAALRGWGRQQQDVKYVSSFSDIIKRQNKDMNGGDTSYWNIPQQRDLISQYALMFQMSLPFGLGLKSKLILISSWCGWMCWSDTRGYRIWSVVGGARSSHENGLGMLVDTALALDRKSVV